VNRPSRRARPVCSRFWVIWARAPVVSVAAVSAAVLSASVSTRSWTVSCGMSGGAPGGVEGVLEQHRDGHRADAAGDGSDPPRRLADGLEVHVADEPVAAL